MLPAIEGLRYLPDYLDRATHDALLASADRQPWQWTVDHRFQVYGYRYHHPTRSVVHIGGLPEWTVDLVERLRRDFGLPAMPNQMVVNEYEPGSGFFMHIDQAAFGDWVASVSLGSSCVMQFARGDDDRVDDILLEPRSVLLLSGEARWGWRHGIPARTVDAWHGREMLRSRRVSLTFRVVPAPDPSQEDRGGAE